MRMDRAAQMLIKINDFLERNGVISLELDNVTSSGDHKAHVYGLENLRKIAGDREITFKQHSPEQYMAEVYINGIRFFCLVEREQVEAEVETA